MEYFIGAVLGAVIGILLGFLGGTMYRKKVAEKEIGSAEEEATRIVNEACLAHRSRLPDGGN